jgi:hypothetical protein
VLLQLDDGQKVPVDFGRKKDLGQVDIESGKDVVVLAEPMRVGNKKILTAVAFSLDGHQVDVNWLKGTQSRKNRRQQVSMVK